MATQNASAARTPAAAQWIGKLDELTGRTFPAPSVPLTGSELEQAVDEALDDLYGPEWGRGWEHVAIAVRALYAGAGFPLMLPAFAPGTPRPERVSTTRRADEIQAATGCDFKAAVRRAEREEIAAYGAPLHMCDAARAQAETLAELYPGRTFTPVIEPMRGRPAAAPSSFSSRSEFSAAGRWPSRAAARRSRDRSSSEAR